jgi:hypothetical protein
MAAHPSLIVMSNIKYIRWINQSKNGIFSPSHDGSGRPTEGGKHGKEWSFPIKEDLP